MAKSPNKSSLPDQDGEMSFTMVKFTLKGSDTSLQKGMDAIRSAFAQAGFSALPTDVRLPKATPARQASVNDSEQESEQEVVDVEATETTSEETVESQPRKPAPPRKYKIINELVFDDVTPTLLDFCAEKDPQTDLDRYKCIAYWFKHTKGIPDLTVPHFYTAYQIHGWKSPKNAGQPVSDLRKSQVLINGEKHGASTISSKGEAQVRSLPKTS